METMYCKNAEEVMIYLQNATDIRLEVQDYKVGRDRNSYFDSHAELYDTMMNNFEDLTFFVDLTSELRDEFKYNPQTTIEEFFDVMHDGDISDLYGYDELPNDQQQNDMLQMNLEELKEFSEDKYNSMISILDGLTDDDFYVRSDGEILFDCDYIDEKINEATYDALTYWTIYFEPNYFDEEIAQLVGLVPFEYEGTRLLALGGCGMDLSPKLDAYVALVHRHIPEDSQFFRQKDYFEYVVGSKVTKMIEEKCKLKTPHYILSFDREVGVA